MTATNFSTMKKADVSAGGRLTGRSRMLAALRGERLDRPPMWFMRQAGRHLPGYRELREKYSFLDLCAAGEGNRLASLEPFERYGVDAVIVFNDILIPLRDMGMDLDFVPGPKFGKLVRTSADVKSLSNPRYDQKTDVARCISVLRHSVGDRAAVLGFVGSPFTVGAFAIGGVGSDRPALGPLMKEMGGAFEQLQERLIEVLTEYAVIQAQAGADAIQVFESLAESVEASVYRETGLPTLLKLVRRIQERLPGTPVIVFGRGLADLAVEIAATGATLSIEPTASMAEIRRKLKAAGLKNSFQGNLEPEALLLSPRDSRAKGEALLAQWREIVPRPEVVEELGPTGWVFNLGHGVPAAADPESVQGVVDAVKSFDWRK